MKFGIGGWRRQCITLGQKHVINEKQVLPLRSRLEPVEHLAPTTTPLKVFSHRSLASTGNSIYLGEFVFQGLSKERPG